MTAPDPVKPSGMRLVFLYNCPFCREDVLIPAPLAPGNLRCPSCRNVFPIVPVDEKTVQYIHTMLLDGRAAADLD